MRSPGHFVKYLLDAMSGGYAQMTELVRRLLSKSGVFPRTSKSLPFVPNQKLAIGADVKWLALQEA